MLRGQAATAGLLEDGESLTGARAEPVELLLWAVNAVQLPAERARTIGAKHGPEYGNRPEYPH